MKKMFKTLREHFLKKASIDIFENKYDRKFMNKIYNITVEYFFVCLVQIVYEY